MIVLDASAAVEILTNSQLGAEIGWALSESGEHLIAPHIFDIEVMHALRGLNAAQRIDGHYAELAIQVLTRLPVQREPQTNLLPRIWQLRHNFTAYDACYIALAEFTGATLYTCDAKLRKGHRANVRVFA